MLLSSFAARALTLFSTGSGAPANVDSARQNLAGTFVNAFVNAGFGNDKLMVGAEEGQSWIYKNKEHGESLDRPTEWGGANGVFQVCSALQRRSGLVCSGTPTRD